MSDTKSSSLVSDFDVQPDMFQTMSISSSSRPALQTEKKYFRTHNLAYTTQDIDGASPKLRHPPRNKPDLHRKYSLFESHVEQPASSTYLTQPPNTVIVSCTFTLSLVYYYYYFTGNDDIEKSHPQECHRPISHGKPDYTLSVKDIEGMAPPAGSRSDSTVVTYMNIFFILCVCVCVCSCVQGPHANRRHLRQGDQSTR